MLARLRSLSEHPEQVSLARVGEGASPADLKRELHVLLQLLTNVVNDDVRAAVERGVPPPDEGVGRSHPALQVEGSSLKEVRWRAAVHRAYELMHRLPSDVHRDALLDGDLSPVAPTQAVLNNIADGYDVLPGLTDLADAVRRVALQHDPFLTAAELEAIFRNSKGLVAQLAALNVAAQNAAFEALRVPESDEGTMAPLEPWVDPSNLRYDAKRRRVAYRKPLSRFQVSPVSEIYPWAWAAAQDHGQPPVVGDVVVEEAAGNLTLGCPALVPLDRAHASPLLQQWYRFVGRHSERVASDYRRSASAWCPMTSGPRWERPSRSARSWCSTSRTSPWRSSRARPAPVLGGTTRLCTA